MIALTLLTLTLAINDPCNANPDCNSCIKQQYCGWCSTPVVYRDGSPGFQCAGFFVNGSANPFVCHGVYSTVACLAGWQCGPEKYCIPSDPGSGTDKATCEANCTNTGLTYKCDNQTSKCVIAPAGSGGSLDECQKTCTKPPVPIAPATPSAPSAPSGSPTAPPAPFAVVPGTPTQLIGLWRGVQINNGYTSGEYVFRFDNTTVTIVDPSGTSIVAQTIQPLGGNPSNQFWVNLPSGGTLKFLFEDAPSGPETINILTAHGPKNGDAPVSIVASLNAPGSAAFALSTCVPGTPCLFKSPVGLKAVKPKQSRSLKQADQCSPQPTCTQCLATRFCGWCSGTVKYSSGRIGAHCVGFDNSTDHFTCNGTYATINCPQLYACNIAAQQCVLSDTGTYSSLSDCQTACVTAQTYECNTTTWQCYPSTPGHGSSLPVCKDQCNATKPPPVPSPLTPNSPSSPAVNPPLPPVNPVTPPVLVGVWRGIKIDRRYVAGEWDFVFDMSGHVKVYDHGREVFEAIVGISDQGWLILNITAGSGVGDVHVANYQVANADSVTFVTLALGGAGVTGHLPDYNEAMTDPASLEFVLVRCVAASCVFNPPSRPQISIN